MPDHCLVLVSCSSNAEAHLVSRRLVGDLLAAGVQRFPIQSTYRWKGEIVEDDEVLLIIKTTAERFEAIKELVTRLHSYEVPQIVMINVAAGHQPYLDWISDSTVGR